MQGSGGSGSKTNVSRSRAAMVVTTTAPGDEGLKGESVAFERPTGGVRSDCTLAQSL